MTRIEEIRERLKTLFLGFRHAERLKKAVEEELEWRDNIIHDLKEESSAYQTGLEDGPKFWPEFLVIGTFRYVLGRTSYAVWEFEQWVKKNWAKLTPNTQALIERELEEAFTRDDLARRKRGGDDIYRLPLGHDCDRDSWERVRELYRNKQGEPH